MPAGSDDTSDRVSYSIKELLEGIRDQVTTINIKLDTKAEKSIVDALDRRVSVIETSRSSEQNYGNGLITEFRNNQREIASNRERLVVLEQARQDGRNFNVLWIPIIANAIGVAIALYIAVR